MRLLQIIPISVVCFSLTAQAPDQKRSPTFGVYAGGIPMQYRTWISAGLSCDLPLTTRRFLSTSITYFGITQLPEDHLTLTSGFSWNIERMKFIFRPGLQLGYLYIAQGSMQQTGYRFHGLYLKASTEYMWKIERCELGVHMNWGIGMGPTQYASGFPPPSLKLGLSGGVGLAFRYKLSQR